MGRTCSHLPKPPIELGDFFGDLATAYAGAVEFSRRDGATDLASGHVTLADCIGQFRRRDSLTGNLFIAESCQAMAC